MRALAFLSAVIFLNPLPVLAQTAWKLVWADEFNGPVNSTPDPVKWAYDLGNNNGWGNRELEIYTNLPQNAHLDGRGSLVIHVESTPAGYTSARLKTQGRFTVQYGRIESRIKIPTGQGIWPAFWMLGNDIASVGWPQCGEIDIMENIGKEPNINHASVHGPGYSGGNPITTTYKLSGESKFASDFHTFAIEWTPQEIVFSVDGTTYQSVKPARLPSGARWVFDHPFFLLLNVAVGGNFPGPPDASTRFPVEMLVDYVRVYQATTTPADSANAAVVADAASYNLVLAPGTLAALFGGNMARTTATDLFDGVNGAFRQIAAGVSVLVNGAAAALTYVSPGQINFQIPWTSLIGTPLNVEILRDDVLSNAIPITLAETAPSAFENNGVAILTCPANARPGATCTVWANGLGATIPPQQDGAPAPPGPFATTARACSLTVGGAPADVTFCGAGPGTIIYQVDFVYPAGIASSSGTIEATLAVGGKSGRFLIPALI